MREERVIFLHHHSLTLKSNTHEIISSIYISHLLIITKTKLRIENFTFVRFYVSLQSTSLSRREEEFEIDNLRHLVMFTHELLEMNFDCNEIDKYHLRLMKFLSRFGFVYFEI